MRRVDFVTLYRAAPAGCSAALVNAAALAVLVGADGSPFWQAVRVAAVVAATVIVLRLLGRRGRGRSVGALAFGLVGLVAGVGIGVRHATVAGFHWRAVAGLVALAAGSVLFVIGVRAVVHGRRGWRLVGATGSVVLGTAVALWLLLPGVLATNVPPTELGSSRLGDHGVAATDVVYPADDGTRLAGWYVPSRTGAAVVLRHGAGSTRTSVIPQAVVLAAHGYGVLLPDARGHGESGGRAMDFGWNGDADISAAIDFLVAQPDVDPTRIGVVGMSMGGEEAVGAAAADARIAAVVAEGATGRSNADKGWLDDVYGMRGSIQQGVEWVQFAFTDLLTDAPRPTPLATAVRDATDCRFLLIAAGEVPDEGDAAEHVRAGAPERVEVWLVPGSAHTAGLSTDPAGWEQRVIGFLDDALRVGTAG